MTNKLTLKLDKEIIELAKIYAKHKNTSLSELVEKYFADLTKEYKMNNQLAPLTGELLGVMKEYQELQVAEEYTNYLVQKYQ